MSPGRSLRSLVDKGDRIPASTDLNLDRKFTNNILDGDSTNSVNIPGILSLRF